MASGREKNSCNQKGMVCCPKCYGFRYKKPRPNPNFFLNYQWKGGHGGKLSDY